jgi:hypothetical protein
MSLTKVSYSMIDGASVNVLDYGADPTGVSDSTTAIQLAIATGKSIYFGGYGNIFLISGSLSPSAGQCLFGENATLKTTSNIPMIVMASYCTVIGLRFEGNSTGSSQRGIFIDGSPTFATVWSTRVSSCEFLNLGGAGYYVARVVRNHEGNILTNSIFSRCNYGIDVAERGEYTTISSCNIDRCTQGIRIIGGNTVVVGCSVSDCTIGFLVGRGDNDAHGTVSSCLINHSGQYAVKFENPFTEDFRFADCEIYFGSIWCYRSNGMSFANCTFGSLDYFYFQGSIDTYFQSCRFLTLPTFTNNYNSEPSKTHWIDTQYATLTSGTSSPNINGAYVDVELTVNTTISTGTQIVPFNTLVFNSMTNNINYTYQSFWNSGTYTFQNIAAVKSPNTNFDCDVVSQLSIGINGTTDYDLINVYLYDVINNRVVANFTPSVKTYGTVGAVNWRIYTLTGRVPKTNYRILVENATGANITCWREQGSTIPFKTTFTSF